MSKVYAVLIACAVLFSSSVSAQVPLPYVESFDSYTSGQPLNGNGGIVATSHVYVTNHGVVGNSGEFQMSASALHDTLISPLIGPLTANSATTFFFRVVTFSGTTPAVYNMTASDFAQIIVGNTSFTLSSLQYTINSGNQNTTTNYIRATVPIPAILAGFSGKFKIVTSNASGHSWLLEMDSLIVRDTLAVPPVLTATVINDSCRSDSTGSIHITATGATPPYRYAWSTGIADTTATISHRPAGIYTVTVTDHIGATAVRTDTIREPALQLLVDSMPTTNIKCNGDATGTAAIYPKGGSPAYTYFWNSSPPQTTQQAQNLTAGNYSVTVTDSRGCTVSATKQLTQPPVRLTATMTSSGSTGNNGTATAIANGGTSPFTYVWAPTSQTTPIATNLAPGQYFVTITDGNHCTLIDSVVVSNLIAVDEIADSKLTLYPNPASSYIYFNIADRERSAVSLHLADMSGREVLVDDNTSSNYINVSRLTDGVYIMKINSGDKTYIRRIVIGK